MRKLVLFTLIASIFALFTPSAHANPWYGPWLMHNLKTGKCVDVPGYGPGRPDGPVNQYTCAGSGDNQLWQFAVKEPDNGRTVVAVYNDKDKLCLDLPYYGSVAPGTRVTEYPCAGPEDNQYFVMVPRTGGSLDGYWLVHQKSGLCLDVDGFGDGGNDAPLTLWHCSDTDDHAWQHRVPWYFN